MAYIVSATLMQLPNPLAGKDDGPSGQAPPGPPANSSSKVGARFCLPRYLVTDKRLASDTFLAIQARSTRRSILLLLRAGVCALWDQSWSH